MKNTITKSIAIILVGYLFTLAQCFKDDPPTVPTKATVHVSTIEGFRNTIYMGSIMHKSSMIAGFEHPYDTCYLTVTNQGSSTQDYYKNPIEPIFTNISLSKGLFSFYVDTSVDPPIISFTKSFIAYSQPDSVRAGQEYSLELEEEVRQSLVLVDVNTVDGTPQLEVGLTTLPMQRQGDWWFAYSMSVATIHSNIGGDDVLKGVPFDQGTIYVWSAVKGRITTKDGFDTVVYL